MTDLTIRRADARDVPAIVAMLYDDELGRQREVVSDPLLPAYTDAFAAIDGDLNQLLAVAELTGHEGLAGSMQLTFIPGLSHQGLWRGQVESVRVASGLRGQRVGRRMLEWAIETCRQKGCGMVQLTSSASRTEARRFYENLGFEVTHLGFKRDLR